MEQASSNKKTLIIVAAVILIFVVIGGAAYGILTATRGSQADDQSNTQTADPTLSTATIDEDLQDLDRTIKNEAADYKKASQALAEAKKVEN